MNASARAGRCWVQRCPAPPCPALALLIAPCVGVVARAIFTTPAQGSTPLRCDWLYSSQDPPAGRDATSQRATIDTDGNPPHHKTPSGHPVVSPSLDTHAV